jgi:hypothetical protein
VLSFGSSSTALAYARIACAKPPHALQRMSRTPAAKALSCYAHLCRYPSRSRRTQFAAAQVRREHIATRLLGEESAGKGNQWPPTNGGCSTKSSRCSTKSSRGARDQRTGKEGMREMRE